MLRVVHWSTDSEVLDARTASGGVETDLAGTSGAPIEECTYCGSRYSVQDNLSTGAGDTVDGVRTASLSGPGQTRGQQPGRLGGA